MQRPSRCLGEAKDLGHAHVDLPVAIVDDGTNVRGGVAHTICSYDGALELRIIE
jgi:hypothetical protein